MLPIADSLDFCSSCSFRKSKNPLFLSILEHLTDENIHLVLQTLDKQT